MPAHPDETRGWHRRFDACAVICGRLHIRGTTRLDVAPFKELSPGYPNQWDPERGIGAYLHEVTQARS